MTTFYLRFADEAQARAELAKQKHPSTQVSVLHLGAVPGEPGYHVNVQFTFAPDLGLYAQFRVHPAHPIYK